MISAPLGPETQFSGQSGHSAWEGCSGSPASKRQPLSPAPQASEHFQLAPEASEGPGSKGTVDPLYPWEGQLHLRG